jgi:hypothetical protein
VSQRAKYVLWIGASGVAGLIAGLLVSCHESNPWRGLALIGLPPALLLAPVIRLFGGRGFDWMVLTFIGVFPCYFSTLIGYAIYALIVSYAGAGIPQSFWAQPLSTVLFTTVPTFIGGVPLAVAQLYALRRAAGNATWLIATMLGSAALGPLSFTALGILRCDAAIPPTPLLGVVGGLLYGFVTAMALGMRLSTWTSARNVPRPPIVR